LVKLEPPKKDWYEVEFNSLNSNHNPNNKSKHSNMKDLVGLILLWGIYIIIGLLILFLILSFLKELIIFVIDFIIEFFTMLFQIIELLIIILFKIIEFLVSNVIYIGLFIGALYIIFLIYNKFKGK
jgi:uncharacterized membrane protein